MSRRVSGAPGRPPARKTQTSFPSQAELSHSPTNNSLNVCPSQIAQLDPKLVMTVTAGVSRNLPERDWSANGVEVEMCPSERNGANRTSRVDAGAVEVDVVGLDRLAAGAMVLGGERGGAEAVLA